MSDAITLPEESPAPARLPGYREMVPHELEHHLRLLLADHTLPPDAPLEAFAAWLCRREEQARLDPYAAGLTTEERVCGRVMDLDDQVCNGGIFQWVHNGYAFQYHETLEALESISARRLKRIITRAISVLPGHVQHHLQFGARTGGYWWLRISARAERRLDRLTDRYYAARDSGITFDEHLLRFVRERHVGPAAQSDRS